MIIGIAVAACLLPFTGKAFHIDDPMYLWAAEQIASDPLDFYGFDVNWHGFIEPNYVANKNPPLIGFFLAAVSVVFGWSERGLHLGMLLPMLALLGALHGIARRLTASPLAAAVALLALPVVWVSGTTLMSDVLMLSLWCGSLLLWMRGLERRSLANLLGAALLCGLCPLVKYFGLALLPLLAAYAFARERSFGRWTATLLIPLAIVGAYEAHMRARYGWSPLGDIASYAINYAPGRERYSPLERGGVGLLFLGGCTLPVLFAAPFLWSRRALLGWFAAVVCAAAAVPALGQLGRLPLIDEQGARGDVALQMGLFGVAGVHALVLAGLDLRSRRDAGALLLVLWLGGTWFFATFTNWTTTARSILPLAPALVLVLVRALERRGGAGVERRPLLLVPLAAGAIVSLLVAHADAGLANTARRAAQELTQTYAPRTPRLLFQGAWGFQQYMQQRGFERLRIDGMQLDVGDIVITPATNTNLVELPARVVRVLATEEYATGGAVATLSVARGAGFYASLWGPLPFTFGPVPPERYTVVQIVAPYRAAFRPPVSSPPR